MLRVVCARRSCSRPLFSSVLPRQCSRSLPIYCTSLPYLGFELYSLLPKQYHYLLTTATHTFLYASVCTPARGRKHGPVHCR